MTTYRYCVLACDYEGRHHLGRPLSSVDLLCGEESSPEPTIALARKSAREQGWRRKDGKDLCPFHASRTSAGHGPVS